MNIYLKIQRTEAHNNTKDKNFIKKSVGQRLDYVKAN